VGGCVVQIPAGGEGFVSGPGENGDERIFVVAKRLPFVLQLEARAVVDAVADLRPDDRDGDDVVFFLVEDVLLVHWRLLNRSAVGDRLPARLLDASRC
jgi:hypothetical protein